MTLFKKLFSFATVTLIAALALGSIAAWYSIQGLMAIFAAAVVPIIIMGGALEFAKIVTTVWLHRYWNRARWQMKLYLVPAVMALAFLTSMGIFGFLSKAHSDQALVSGDIQSKIAVFDQKIDTAKQNIEADRRALTQMDAQVDQLLGRTTDDKGANRAVTVRKQQSTERNRLNKDIEAGQASIVTLNDQAAPIRAQVRKVEAEVGPIKYIAALIYGDNPSNDLLERAVRWVIIVIVFVFDPLALTLVLAAQSSYEWLEEDAKKEQEQPVDEPEEVPDDATDNIPTDDAEPDVTVGEELPEEHLPDTIEHMDELEPIEDRPAEPDIEPNAEPTVEEELPADINPEIKTDGVTIEQLDNDYLMFEGKAITKHALESMRPNIFAARPDAEQINTNFGITFPVISKKGDIFVRVDSLPNRVYKFDGLKWIEVNKEQTDSYLYDKEYLNYLVVKIEKGEYDLELLSENEKVEIEQYLRSNRLP
jgi:hypothetical protein